MQVSVVMDADTIVAAMRSPGCASAEILRIARTGGVTITATLPIEHVEPAETGFLWRP
jgi:hypothetical protein